MKNPKVGVGVLIFNNKGEILLGKRIAAHGNSEWGAVGGHLEFGETFEACAMREVLEEVGINIASPTYAGITNDFFEQEQKHYISIFMKCNYDGIQPILNCEPHKIEEWQWFDFANLPKPLFLPLKNYVEKNGYGYK